MSTTPTAATLIPSTPRVVLPVLAVGMFGTYLNYAVISPLLPDVGLTYGISDALAGQAATIALIVGFVTTLIATPFMDRQSPRWWIIVLSSVMVLSAVVSAWAPTFGWFIVGRVLSGIGGSVLSANIYAAARQTYADSVTRTRVLGAIASAASFAVIAGLPVITLIGARFGWRVGMLAVGLPFVVMILGALMIPPPVAAPDKPRVSALEAFRSVLSHREAVWLMVCFAIMLGTCNGWLVYFGAFSTVARGISPAMLSVVFLVGGVVELLFSNLAPRFVERYGLSRVIIVGIVINAVPLLLTFWVQGAIAIALACAIFSFGSIMAYVGLYARVLDIDHAQSGALLAMVSAAIGLGSAIGPLLSGWTISATGSYDIAYFIIGVYLLLCVAAYVRAERAAT